MMDKISRITANGRFHQRIFGVSGSGRVKIVSWLLMATLTGVMLAGCMGNTDSQDPSEPQESGGFDEGSDPRQTSETSDRSPGGNGGSGQDEGSGEVRGFVANEGNEPLAEAQVTLIDPADNREVDSLSTEEDGGFVFDEVPVGEYRVHAAHSCCREHLERIVVDADETTRVEVVLPVFTEDQLQRHYVEKYEWEGFVACDMRLWWFTGLMGPSDYCLDENHDFGENFTVHEGLRTLAVVLEWDPVLTNVPGDMELRIVRGLSSNPFAQNFHYQDLDGDSPLETRIDAGQFNETGDEQYDFYNIEGESGISFWVFGGSDESFGVTYQQPVTIHYHLFYWEHAPEDYDLLSEMGT